MDTATFRGRETTTTGLGQEWRVSRFTLDRMDAFRDWAATVLPDPIAVAEVALLRHQREAWAVARNKDMPEDEQAFLLAANEERQERISKLAMELATSYLSFLSRPVQTLLRDPRGTAHYLLVMLREHHKDVTEETCYELGQVLGQREVDRILLTTMGKGSDGGNAEAPAA